MLTLAHQLMLLTLGAWAAPWGANEDAPYADWLPLGCTSASAMPANVLTSVGTYDSNAQCAKAAFDAGSQYFSTSINAFSTTKLSCYILTELTGIDVGTYGNCTSTPAISTPTCALSKRACTGGAYVSFFVAVFPQFNPSTGITSRLKTVLATPNWRMGFYSPGWGQQASLSRVGYTISSQSTASGMTKDSCQNLCEADLKACAFGWGSQNMALQPGGAAQTTTCRCWQCVINGNDISAPVAPGESAANIYVRDLWGIGVNSTEESGVILRNGTVLPLSICGRLDALSMNVERSNITVIKDRQKSTPTTEFTSTCSGSSPCSWEYSYSTTSSKEISNSFGLEISAEWGVDVLVFHAQASVAASYGYSDTRGSSETATSTVGGTLSVGQTARVSKSWRELTYRGQRWYRLYGGLRALRSMGSATTYCYPEDISQTLNDVQTQFVESQDITETVSVYSVESTV